jgi:hypothetical protein
VPRELIKKTTSIIRKPDGKVLNGLPPYHLGATAMQGSQTLVHGVESAEVGPALVGAGTIPQADALPSTDQRLSAELAAGA